MKMKNSLLAILLAIPLFGWAKLDDSNFNKAKECLGKRESNNKYEVVNSLGYMGKYQFGYAALEDIGFIRKGCYAKYRHKAPASCWSGKLGTYSRYGFLKSKKAQEEAIKLHFSLNYSRLIKNGTIKESDSQIKKAQAHFVAHLLGATAAYKYFKYNKDSKDGYGTKASEYSKLAKECLK